MPLSFNLCILLILGSIILASAHPQPYHGNEEECTCEPGAKAFESYHIHVLFYPDLAGGEFVNNTHGSRFARALRKKFIERFDVPECSKTGSIFNLTKLCAFEVDATGSGYERNTAPFVAPNL